MNYYTLIKTAGPKEKIGKYRITDPVLIYFINNFEHLIDWNTIEDEKSIQEQITQKLVHNVFQPSNYFLQDINLQKEFAHSMDLPFVQRAETLYGSGDIDGAKHAVLYGYNKQKKDVIEEWDSYLWENTEYRKNPAFVFLVMNALVRTSNPKTKRPPPELNAAALAGVWDKMHATQIPQFDIMKTYNKEVIKSRQNQQDSIESRKDVTGWIRVPSKVNDPENFNKNVQYLMSLCQGKKVCVERDGMARSYLNQGDFHIYLENGDTKVVIRLEGNKVSEIRGYANKQPNAYWEEVYDFLKKSNFEYEDNTFYKNLMKEASINLDLQEGKYEEVMEEFKKSPLETYIKLSKKNKANFPQLRGYVVNAAAQKIEQAIGKFNSLFPRYFMPVEKRSRPFSILSTFQQIVRVYEELPRDIQQDIPETTMTKFIKLSQQVTKSLPETYAKVPKDLLKYIDREQVVKNLPKVLRRAPELVGEILTDEEVANLNPKEVTKYISDYIKGTLKGERMYPAFEWDRLPQVFRKYVTDNDKFLFAQKILQNMQAGYTAFGPADIPKDLLPYIDLGSLAKLWDKELLNRQYIIYREDDNAIPKEVLPYMDWAALQAVAKHQILMYGNVKEYFKIPEYIRKYIPEQEIAMTLMEDNIYRLPYQDDKTLKFLLPYFDKKEIETIHRQNLVNNPSLQLPTKEHLYQTLGVQDVTDEERMQYWKNFVDNIHVITQPLLHLIAMMPEQIWNTLPTETKDKYFWAFAQYSNNFKIDTNRIYIPWFFRNHKPSTQQIPQLDQNVNPQQPPQIQASKNWYKKTKLSQQRYKIVKHS